MLILVRHITNFFLAAVLGGLLSIPGCCVYMLASGDLDGPTEGGFYLLWLVISALLWLYWRTDAIEAWEREKLTCHRCKSLASPIAGTHNRYRCGSCGRQFAASRHSF